MTTHKNLSPEDLAAAALPLVAEAGIGGLTLRPLAARLGTSVTVITYQFGQKDEVLELVIQVAAAREARYLDGWRTQMAGAEMSVATANQTVEAIAADLVSCLREGTTLLSELLFNVDAAPGSAALEGWLSARQAFCTELAARLSPRPPYDLGDMLHFFLIEESAYGLALDGIDSYRWLRRLCLSRLLGGLAPHGANPADASLFAAHFETLRTWSDAGFIGAERTFSGARAAVALACAELVATSGVSNITHRAVARLAGLAPSSVAHHFPTQPELVLAGLSALIPSDQTPVSPNLPGGRPYQGIEIARAGFGIALAATRDANWRAVAAEMRAMRAYFLREAMIESMAPKPFDHLGAQAAVMCTSGRANQYARSGPETASAEAFGLLHKALDTVRSGA